MDYLGIPYTKYLAVDLDQYAIQSYNDIHGTNYPPMDITQLESLNIKDSDKYSYWLFYSFPCTDISNSGKMEGFKEESGTRSSLLWQVKRLLENAKENENSLPEILVMENVPGVLTIDSDSWRKWVKFLEDLGYSNYCKVLNAKDYGIPQNRKRAFMVSILGDYSYTFPKPIKLEHKLKDFLEKDVDEKYYLSKDKLEKIKQWKSQQDPLKDIDKEKEVCPCLTARGAGEEHSGMILINENAIDIPLKRGYSVKIKNESEETNSIDVIRNYSKSGFNQTPIVGKNGIAPTVTENHGQVFAVIDEDYASRQIKKAIDKNDGELPDLIDIYNASDIKSGILPTMTTKSGRFGGSGSVAIIEKTDPILLGGIGEMDSNGGSQWKQQNRIYSSSSSTAVTTGYMPSFTDKDNLRIRKLTECECLRLMGVKDRDSNKMTLSKSQKYKQAGNSIVVQVLMGIFGELLGVDYQTKIKESIKDIKNE